MRPSFRVAAFAAAALAFCGTAGLPEPSLASESDAGPAVSYTDHDRTELPVHPLGLNPAEEQAVDAEATQPGEAPASSAEHPVSVHEQAPVLPHTGQEEATSARAGRSLADLVADFSAIETPDAETECLARAVYYEAKGESYTGQLTVAEVILNRAESGRFPSTICGVVRQPSQFSFVRRGHIPQPPVASRDWRIAVAIARIAMEDLAEGAAPRALFFHARHVRPGWRLTRVATVGNHVFYR